MEKTMKNMDHVYTFKMSTNFWNTLHSIVRDHE